MKRLALITALIFLFISSYQAQSIDAKRADDDDIALQKLWLLSDLQTLETESKKIKNPVARAAAEVEIADAAWALDQGWAKTLIREAYELTFPSEEEQIKLRNQPVGAAPKARTALDRARNEVRNRAFSIAGRDKAFLDELAGIGAQKLGKYEEHLRQASLAAQAIEAGDKEAASRHILQSIEADPTQISAGRAILDLAAKDRAAADRLIIQYIERLRTTSLSFGNQSIGRTYLVLNELVFPNASRQLVPPGPPVMKAYVTYIIESLGKLERIQPGFLKRAREILLTTWLPLKQYSPELTGAFLQLEKLSRSPGDDASLPQVSDSEANKERYEKRVQEALNGNQPDEPAINFAINQENFDKARKMIEKLSEGPQKTQLTEMVNAREALSLATKDSLVEAEGLAEQLNKATSILQVYPVIINKCVASKDQPCAIRAVHQSIKQLKRANTESAIPPAGIPASAIVTSGELDPVLLSLSKLAKEVASINEILALEILDEAILAANSSKMSTDEGRTGFDVDVFRKLAPHHESRVRQAAGNLKDPLRQIVALAAIYQWKAAELVKRAKPGL